MTTKEFRKYVESVFPAKRFVISGQIYNDKRKTFRRFKVYMRKKNGTPIDSFDIAVIKTLIKNTGLKLYSDGYWNYNHHQILAVFVYKTAI